MLLAAVAAGVFAADLLTKVWAAASLVTRDVEVLGGLVVFHTQRNPGAAFSLAGGATVLFTLIAAGVAAYIVRQAPRLRSARWAIALGLILGGALGNLADRLFRTPGPLRGHVVDFIDLQWHGRSVWPVFNIADMAIVTGGVLAVVLAWREVPAAGPPDEPRDTET